MDIDIDELIKITIKLLNKFKKAAVIISILKMIITGIFLKKKFITLLKTLPI